MDLSIGIVNWNVRESLRNCLESIRQAAPRLQHEIIVVDNASTDGSPELVGERFPAVTLIRNETNRGFAAGCNQAMRKSRGRYLLLLNPDTEVPSGTLEEMVRFLKEHPETGAAVCRLVYPDGRLQRSIRAFPTGKSVLGEHTILGDLGFFTGARRAYSRHDFDYDREAFVEQPMGAALFLRRSALDEVGLLDEGFFLYFEEVDLCRRLADAGYPIRYNPRCSITHVGGESTARAGAESLYHLLKSELYYLKKHRVVHQLPAFTAAFKLLFTAGLIWGMAGNEISLAAKRLLNAPAPRREKTARRLAMKREFLAKYLFKFLRSG